MKPHLWDDNYIALMPGEKREVTATFEKKQLMGAVPRIRVDGFNVAEEE